MAMMGEMLNLGSMMGTLMLVYTVFKQFLPPHLKIYFEKYFHKIVRFIYPYVEITFDEYTGEFMKRNEAYSAIKSYLSDKSSASAKRLKANVVKDSQSVVLTMDYNEVTDKFQGVKVWWSANKTLPSTQRMACLYGPPGTTKKSSMIADMVNLLDYDVYELELTAVKDFAELRRLLLDTLSKSIVVIEDIDCSLDLTGQREKKKTEKDGKDEEQSDPITKKVREDEKKESKVTLSGLLNYAATELFDFCFNIMHKHLKEFMTTKFASYLEEYLWWENLLMALNAPSPISCNLEPLPRGSVKFTMDSAAAENLAVCVFVETRINMKIEDQVIGSISFPNSYRVKALGFTSSIWLC
ncbi:hypothetical protein GQ457_07G002180 [Hibiscus cannabinus]